VLEATCDVLDSFNKLYWIDSGTMLSAHRDRDINIYDHDIDIRTLRSEWTTRDVADLVRSLWLMGYARIIDSGEAWEQILAYHIKGVLLDFKFCHQDEEHVWYHCFGNGKVVAHLYDRKFIDNITGILLFDRIYPCPGPVEEYIEAHYGPDWREFKARAERAGDTDMTWDYMKDPPICYTPEEFQKLKGRELGYAVYPSRWIVRGRA